MHKIYIEGHRGYCADYPENTLLSYEKAIELGVDAIEFDVWLSKDKVPVLMHDENPLRTCGVNGSLRDMTLAEIKTLCPSFASRFGDTFAGRVEVPTLYELLELVKTKKPELKLGVEIKEYTEETVDLTVQALKEYGVFEQCWFYAFNGRIIRYLKETWQARTMGYPDFQMKEFEGYDYYDEIGLNMNLVRSELCDHYRAKGLPIHMYCADTAEDVALCIHKGASLITANDPRALLQTLCPCGRMHHVDLKVYSGSQALTKLPDILTSYHTRKAFVLSDATTYQVAGQKVYRLLEEAGIPYTGYSLPSPSPEPDEKSVGSVMMHYEPAADMIIAVGSGVINDIGKILSVTTGRPYIIIATAPSMDGYASASSSMTRDGLKISLPTRSADVIIGDTDILKTAPLPMLQAGLGDMLAKYVSICEWRLSALITGEYYCETIATQVRQALQKCIAHSDGLLKRESTAIEAVFEGLVTCGIAMTHAGLSRPASGVEHYFSHIWDMRSVVFGTPAALHGIQCAIATLETIRLYEKLKNVIPDKEKALAYARHFDYAAWSQSLSEFLGASAQEMIALEAKERKYDPSKHTGRLETILAHWEDIQSIIEEELPSAQTLEQLLDRIQAPKTLSEIGLEESILPMTFRSTKDIRDKYVLSRLCWDLGILEEIL